MKRDMRKSYSLNFLGEESPYNQYLSIPWGRWLQHKNRLFPAQLFSPSSLLPVLIFLLAKTVINVGLKWVFKVPAWFLDHLFSFLLSTELRNEVQFVAADRFGFAPAHVCSCKISAKEKLCFWKWRKSQALPYPIRRWSASLYCAAGIPSSKRWLPWKRHMVPL